MRVRVTGEQKFSLFITSFNASDHKFKFPVLSNTEIHIVKPFLMHLILPLLVSQLQTAAPLMDFHILLCPCLGTFLLQCLGFSFLFTLSLLVLPAHPLMVVAPSLPSAILVWFAVPRVPTTVLYHLYKPSFMAAFDLSNPLLPL